MITNDEINQKAKEYNIPATWIEKDYIYGWILKEIFSESWLGEKLILKGGNALRKGYLSSARFSKDLDFSVVESIDEDKLKNEINNICKIIEERTKVEFDLSKTLVHQKNVPNIDREVLEARAYFKGFYGEENIILKTQMDITQFDRIYLPVQNRNLIHPYSDTNECCVSIKCQKSEEIIASKLNTLLQRRKGEDLFDLLFSLVFNNEFSVNRREVISTFLKKSLFEESIINAKNMLLGIPLEEYRQFWEHLIVPITSFVKFDEAINGFNQLINSLFSFVPAISFEGGGAGRFSMVSYFSSSDRNIIISSGQSKKMIELLYDGYRRFVEPYELEYRVRKSDGAGVEYFWGFDTSGGKSGKQSIKMFICDKIQSMNETNLSFFPRFPIQF